MPARRPPPLRRRAPRVATWAAATLVGAALLALAACRGGVRRGARPAPDLAPAADAGVEADASPRHDLRGLPNYGRVDGGLCRSGQPDAEGYRTARALGVRTVVDLRGSKEGPAGTEAAGLDLVVVRTGARRVSEADVVEFLRVATDPARRPVLVHCASGHDRTGALVAAYRRVVDGWSADEALREMRRFGAAPWYRNLVRLIERLDPAAIRARVDAAPDPADGGARAPAGGTDAGARDGPLDASPDRDAEGDDADDGGPSPHGAPPAPAR
ncbi:MAG: tyrosine-protein phosphatase [Planctomycetota bacterium]